MEYILNFPIVFGYLKEIEEEYRKITNYIDVTKNWIQNAKLNSHTVKDLNYWESNDNKYYVDGKNVVLDYSNSEKKCAEWLENTLGGEIFMCPRINNPDGINTPDYVLNNEYWDLKEINGCGNRTVDTALKKCKNQAHNFIIDISKSQLSNESAIYQLQKIFNNKNRKWVEKIILKRNNKLIKIYTKRD